MSHPANRHHTCNSIMCVSLLLFGCQDDNDLKPILRSDKELQENITSSDDDTDVMSDDSISNTISFVNSLDCDVEENDTNGSIIVTQICFDQLQDLQFLRNSKVNFQNEQWEHDRLTGVPMLNSCFMSAHSKMSISYLFSSMANLLGSWTHSCSIRSTTVNRQNRYG